MGQRGGMRTPIPGLGLRSVKAALAEGLVAFSRIRQFYPDCEADSAYTIDYEDLYERGFRGLIFDIDNTLVPHGAPATEEARTHFCRLREMGFQTMLLSNNRESRVQPFAEEVGSRYLHKAGKPGQAGYKRAMGLMGTAAANTAFVGDQLFTDVWGAKKAGMYTFLVKPIHPKEEIQIVLKRYPERIVLYFYHREKNAGKEQ